MTKEQLALISIDDLLDELARRHDAVLVAVLRKRTDQASDFMIDWRGGVIPCLGLADKAFNDIMEASCKTKESP